MVVMGDASSGKKGNKNPTTQKEEQWEQEIKSWEQKKESYIKVVQPILKKWAVRFDALISGFLEDIRPLVTAQFGSSVMQQKIIASEYERWEEAKRKLLLQANSGGIKAVEAEITEQRKAIKVEKNIVLLQSVVRRWLARKKLAELQKRDRQRKKIVTEILETERAYVNNLGILVKVFLQPLRILSKGSDPLLHPEEITKIFSNCELIYSVHQELFTNLEARIKAVLTDSNKRYIINTKPALVSIGDIFERLSPFLKLYTQYVSNYNIALTTLADAKKRDDAISDFLNELLKHTNKEHPDYIHVSQALSKMQEVAATINESKRHAESLEKLLTIQSYFIGKCEDLVQPHRKFIKEGPLYFFNPKKNPSTKGHRQSYGSWALSNINQDEYYIFLMNDLLIVARRKSSLLDPSQVRYSFIIQIKLLYATLEPLNDTAVIKNGFALISSHVVHTFWCDTSSSRDDWMKVLANVIEQLDKNMSTLRGSEQESKVLVEQASVQRQKPLLKQSNPTAVTNSNNTLVKDIPSTFQNSTTLQVQAVVPKSKLRHALTLYEEVLQLELEIFQVPIDLSTLFPGYYQQLPANYQQLLWGRVQALRARVEKMMTYHDSVLSVIKDERLALRLEKVILEGKGPVGNLQLWAKEKFPPTNPEAQYPRTLVINVMRWLNSLLKMWEQVIDEDCD